MNDDTGGADYRQAEESEMREWLDEMDAKRRMRQLETLHEMSKGLDDGQDTEPDEDEQFTKALEAKYPALLAAWPQKERK